MASQKTKLTVGLFVFFGIVIAVFTFVWLGMSHILERGQYYAIYFDESVQGLDIGSPVKYRGVAVGLVSRIEVAPDDKLIQVIVKIEKEWSMESDIVAQLSVVGITGSMFIELDLKEEGDDKKAPELGFPAEYPILSSKPSEITEILQGIGDFLDQIQAIDLDGISGRIKDTLDNFNQVMADANIKGLSEKLDKSLEDIGRIVEKERWDSILNSVEESMKRLESITTKADGSMDKLDNSLASLENITTGNEPKIKEAIADFKTAMEKVNTLLDNTNSMISGTDDSVYKLGENLNEIAESIKQAAENINKVTDIITDQPSQLLFGEPRAPKKIEK